MDFAYGSLLGMMVLCYVPHTIKAILYKAITKRTPNNADPRNALNVADPVLQTEKAAILRRAQSCHYNLLENFAFFAAGVIAAKVAHVPTATINYYVAMHVLFRVAYVPLYLLISTNPASALRSIAFFGAAYASAMLMISAAYA
ncbi:hypothetical protein CAOG_001849 [Capsaspora owczarzaki ATCC 30864]|uniref:Uncharacterized protein n=2 Tax=Capsaspora owczarzaki (strain ATCC 30864) TaxID=595528 RepID=A0A0D2VKK2_CAPO3|nr:hypothetical protein CAOG_001849 [Capsaspora owczarzaki ATCC 30864]